MLTIDVIALMTAPFESYWNESIMKRAIDAGLVECHITNLREFTTDRHNTVDDMPYGGGVGMVMKPEPIFRAVEAMKKGIRGSDVECYMKCSQNVEIEEDVSNRTALNDNCEKPDEYQDISDWDGIKKKVIVLAPTGERFTQKIAEKLSKCDHLIFICGRYEAMDERVHDGIVDMELSMGDYILTGGELAALSVIDSTVRLIPGAIGGEGAIDSESFSCGYLEYPQYTRPPIFRGMAVPEVLLSGNHKKIEKYRITEGLRRTIKRRPDLIDRDNLSSSEMSILDSLLKDSVDISNRD